ncbi:MAG TPA: AIR synthase-related protein, partial [Candidatus Polarisedimenticolaceae bacterium]|nr:AIR synthase-related protein [Candidatus Polarisedimenticolaceae bacterium]
PPGVRALIHRNSWPMPPIFGMIAKIGAVSGDEMDRTFNNGLGMILVLSKKAADGAMLSLKKSGEKPIVIGEIRKGRRGADII